MKREEERMVENSGAISLLYIVVFVRIGFAAKNVKYAFTKTTTKID